MTRQIARLRIRRGAADAPSSTAAHYDEFVVPFEDGATVLDALIRVRAEQDPSLAIRYSCINANVCKECMIWIDGIVDYACTTRLRSAGVLGDGVMTLEPLPGKAVLRDLVTETRPPRERLK